MLRGNVCTVSGEPQALASLRLCGKPSALRRQLLLDDQPEHRGIKIAERRRRYWWGASSNRRARGPFWPNMSPQEPDPWPRVGMQEHLRMSLLSRAIELMPMP